MDPHRLGELRSLAYHRVIAARIDDAMRARARRRLDEWSQRFPQASAHWAQWRSLLDGDPEALVAVLCADSESARTLRSCTPFAAEVSPRERWSIWRQVASENET